MKTPVIACGTYQLNLQCPECGVVIEQVIGLDTRLTVDAGGARLAAKLVGKPVDHACRQLRAVPAPEPTVVDPDQAGLFRDPDWAERAAGEASGAYGGLAP